MGVNKESENANQQGRKTEKAQRAKLWVVDPDRRRNAKPPLWPIFGSTAGVAKERNQPQGWSPLVA